MKVGDGTKVQLSNIKAGERSTSEFHTNVFWPSKLSLMISIHKKNRIYWMLAFAKRKHQNKNKADHEIYFLGKVLYLTVDFITKQHAVF